MLDVVFRGATVVDGTGSPGKRMDVGVRDGKIVLGEATKEPASRVVDGDGLVLAPGFVDIHTHYDAQFFWDPTVSPSPLHGVTTTLAGNCGFTLAPSGPDDVDYIMRMMSRVEGIPVDALKNGVPWGAWTTFGEYLDCLEGKVAVNVGVLVGHSTLRRSVMGKAAVGEKATPEQLGEMVRVLHESLNAGGLGFTSSQASPHVDDDGQPVPSRFADRDELLTLAAAVSDHPGTSVALLLAGGVGQFSDEEKELMIDYSLAAQRTVNWNVVRISAEHPELHENQLEMSDRAKARGARVVALIQPFQLEHRFSFMTGFGIKGMPGRWNEVLHLPLPERIKALSTPEVRKGMYNDALQGVGLLKEFAQWSKLIVGEVFSSENEGLVGRSIGDIAHERGGDPFEVMLDIVVADGCRTALDINFDGKLTDAGIRLRGQMWQDERTIVGGSDAGAHSDAQCGAIWSTYVLGAGVREQGVISLEAAVRELTDVPARHFGLRGRGRIADGWHADLVLFDPSTIGPEPIHTVYDLPGTSPRFFAEAHGIESVWVNGTELVHQGEFTGAIPGHLMRSGRDTDTVPLPGR